MPKEYPRKLRVNVQLQRELTELIRDELRDPRVTGTTVMSVDVAPDLRNANVRVSRLPPGADIREAAAALNHASGRLRHELKRRLRLRHIPELRFVAAPGAHRIYAPTASIQSRLLPQSDRAFAGLT